MSAFGGGFGEDAFNTTAQFDSPAAKIRKERRIQRVVPVTAKMITDCEGDTLMVHGQEVTMLNIVGLIQEVQITSSKITYIINDGTGPVEAVRWVEDGQSDSEEYRPQMENSYCNIIGNVKIAGGKKYVLIFNLRPVLDINRITTHMLETVFYDIKVKQLDALEDSRALAGPGLEGGFNTGNPSAAAVAPGLTPAQTLVHQVIQLHSDSDAGCNKAVIFSALRGKVSDKDIAAAIDFLSNEGHVYSTIDDDTFKTTDS